MGKIIMVRHGSTPFNHEDKEKDRIRAWIDIPLNEKGLQEAQELAEKLGKTHIDEIYSSDLVRALQTAGAINQFHRLPINQTNSLRPWHVGVFSGQQTAAILPDLKYHQENEGVQIKEGESFKSFKERYLSFMQRIIKRAKSKDIDILIVSHFRNLQTLEAWLRANADPDFILDKAYLEKDEFKPADIYKPSI